MNPNVQDELQKILNEMANSGVPNEPAALAKRLNAIGASIPADELPELIPTILHFFGRNAGHLYTPPVIRSFISSLLENRSANILCDPWAGLGEVLAIAQKVTGAKQCLAFGLNVSETELAKVLFPQGDWYLGQSLQLFEGMTTPLDVVVSNLPFGVRSKEPLVLESASGNSIELRDDLGHLILAAAISHLNDDGMGIFVVPPSFFFSSRSVLNHFSELGFGVEAAFALPAGSFAPYTSILTYLIVVRKKQIERMFVAQLANDEKTDQQILTNFHNKKEGGAVELGRYIEPCKFRSIDSLKSGEYFENASKHFGFPAVKLGNLATTINLGRHGNEYSFPNAVNTVFVPMIGQSDVIDSINELTLKPQNYAQVVIDPLTSHAQFVAQFLNSELGRKIRDWGKTGTTIPKLNKTSLMELKVFVPDLATQQQLIEIEGRIAAEENTLRSLQNELAEYRRDLWRQPRAAGAVSDRLGEFSNRLSADMKEQAIVGLDQWFETLPFPLASILRAWQATPSDDYKTKHEHLLHFFEATAEFLSVILLSAFSANEVFFDPHRKKLTESMKKQNFSFQRATFGTWKLVVEYLGKQTRQLLKESGKKPDVANNDHVLCATIFADNSLALPQNLSAIGIVTILGATNKMRNDWSGHGGVVGQDEAKFRNQQLLGEVENLREAMAGLWENATLVNALHCRPRKGLFENEIAKLRGSNGEFLKESRPMTSWLDVDSLYIINGDQENALKLLPLVRVGPSPKSANNACYFFNRQEREGARFISYHFADQPELSGQFEDAMNAIRFLTES